MFAQGIRDISALMTSYHYNNECVFICLNIYQLLVFYKALSMRCYLRDFLTEGTNRPSAILVKCSPERPALTNLIKFFYK